MCRSQQVNKITETTESSEEECNLIQTFDSCDDFEVMSIESKNNQVDSIESYLQGRLGNKQKCEKVSIFESDVQKIDIRRDPNSERMKSLVRVDHQLIYMTVNTGRPILFLNWTAANLFLESSDQTKFTQAERLNLPAQFVDYNKQPIVILSALEATICLTGWEINEVTFLITDRRTKCILALGSQNKVGISTTQKPAPKKKTRFDVLMCVQSDIWQEIFFSKPRDRFDRQGRSINHVVNTKFKYPLCPIQEKSR